MWSTCTAESVVFTPWPPAPELEIDLLGLGQDGDGGGGGVDAALRLGGGHALHAVDAAFVFHDAVHVISADFDDDFLEPADFGGAGVELLDLPAFGFGKTAVHAQQIGGKEAGFITAGAGANFEDDIAAFERIRRQDGLLDGFFEIDEALFENGNLGGGHLSEFFVLLGLGHDAVLGELDLGFFIRGPVGEEFLQAAVLAQHVAGFFGVVVEVRAADDVFEVGEAGAFAGDDGGVVHGRRERRA
jgi:hypothetical protein